ncbi:MAG: hypothetical protein JW915_21100 [Chitinispirillaceae bacterium]|nr:hypothetical protein [Chitinispirillaceae bacterium]
MWNDLKERPFLVLVLAIGLAVMIYAASFVVTAICVGVGLAITIISGGVMAASASIPWAIPAASSAIVGIGGVYIIKMITIFYNQAKEKPFSFSTATLSLISALLVGLATKYELQDMPLISTLFGVGTAFAVAVGGALLKCEGLAMKLIGFLFPLIPAVFLVIPILSKNNQTILTELQNKPGILMLFAILLIIAILLGIIANYKNNE